MRHLIAVLLIMLAAVPLSIAQDKGKPGAPELSSQAEHARREAEAKQKAKRVRKSCEKQAKAQNLKSEARKKFIKDCMTR